MNLEPHPTVRLKKLALNPATLRILDRPNDEGALVALPDTYFCSIACSVICGSRNVCGPVYTEVRSTCDFHRAPTPTRPPE